MMEPNLILAKGDATGQTSKTKECSEITMKEFLDYLKTAYQVQDSVEGILSRNGKRETVDWLKLKKTPFVKNDIGCQTENDNSSQVIAKLNEILSEGLLDPVLSNLPLHQNSNMRPATRKPSIGSDKSSEKSSNSTMPEKKKPTEKNSSQVEIHVCDEIKKTKKDFLCDQNLLIEKMGYFAEVTAGQKFEDMDISVHCDIGIFEWLMKWVHKESLLEEDWPQINANNVIPIIMSATFLRMEPLLDECLRYCHENMNDILRTSTSVCNLNDAILTRLAAMYTNIELENIRDKKDKLQSKLFTKMIQSLVEPEPECLRGHWSSLASVFRCEKCLQLVNSAVSLKVPCAPIRMRLQVDGTIVSDHVRDTSWNINAYVEKLFKQLKSWRKVYWRLWGNAHFLNCLNCKRYFPANQLGWCLFHPDAPQFFTLDAQKAPLPVGRYPCCGERAYRFQLLNNFRGCKFKEHSICTKSVKESSVASMLCNYKQLIIEEPPELLFAERLTRLVARDITSNEKLTCKEVFWWDGLQITPSKPRFGLLNRFSELRGGQLATKDSSQQASTDEEQSQDDSTSSKGSSRSSSANSDRNSLVVARKKIINTEPCKLWQVDLSTRMNQDIQRSYEEQIFKDMSAALNKKYPSSYDIGGNRQKTTRMSRNTIPIGGIWSKLQQDWREQNFVNSQKYRNQSIKLRKKF